MTSGLYKALVSQGLLIPHEERPLSESDVGAYRVLQPELVPFISYPYEWCAGQIRAAALATLEIMKTALDHRLVLKDANAFNIQFMGSRAVLIDTLSFEIYEEGRPWVAYRQFCESFLAPLALACYQDPLSTGLLRAHLNGLPLPLASRLLPMRTWFRFGVLTHIHMHAMAQSQLGEATRAATRASVSKRSLMALIDSLRRTIEDLSRAPRRSAWSEYETTCSYTSASRGEKAEAVRGFLEASKPNLVIDLGANSGAFSRIAKELGAYVVSIDADHDVIEGSFARGVAEKNARVLPLTMDLTNPSPGLGWDSRERSSLAERGPADAVLALALVHHLALANNIPLGMIAAWLARLGRHVIVEFVPKTDPQSQRLLAVREDVFDQYDRQHMEEALAAHFSIVKTVELKDAGRVLYHCRERT